LRDKAEIMLKATSFGGGTMFQPPGVGNWECTASENSLGDKAKDREQKSANVLAAPGVKIGVKVKSMRRERLANQRSRKALALVEDVEPTA
jgi:hypothetical protein